MATSRRVGLIILGSVLLVASAQPASARPPRRGGVVRSPFGEMYNTNSPEWRASGGNPLVYEQLMEQKMLQRQQQQEVRQQQQAEKQARAQAGGKGKGNGKGKGKDRGTAENTSATTAASPPAKKKTKRTYVPTGSGTSPSGDRAKPGASGNPMADPLKPPGAAPTTAGSSNR